MGDESRHDGRAVCPQTAESVVTRRVEDNAPFRQKATKRKKGCQIDLLLQSDRKICVVEIKRKKDIGREVIDEVEEKVRALDVPSDVSVRTALVYEGNLASGVEAEGYFDSIVSVDQLLKR